MRKFEDSKIHKAMKKIVLSVIMMGLCSMSMMAQEQQQAKQPKEKTQREQTMEAEQKSEKERDFKGLNVAIQGGMLFSMNENSWTYYNDDKSNRPTELKNAREKLGYSMKDLFTPQASIAIGYDFGHAFGVRVQANFAQNASAGNHNENGEHGFYPYTFKSVSTFADAVFNISGFINADKQHLLETKIYAGAGFGRSLSADTKYLPDGKNGGSRYDIEVPSNAFAFRAGLIEELYINKHMGAFVDVNLESYTDKFNGFVSVDTAEDESFPYDLRVVGSFGLVFHF